MMFNKYISNSNFKYPCVYFSLLIYDHIKSIHSLSLRKIVDIFNDFSSAFNSNRIKPQEQPILNDFAGNKLKMVSTLPLLGGNWFVMVWLGEALREHFLYLPRFVTSHFSRDLSQFKDSWRKRVEPQQKSSLIIIKIRETLMNNCMGSCHGQIIIETETYPLLFYTISTSLAMYMRLWICLWFFQYSRQRTCKTDNRLITLIQCDKRTGIGHEIGQWNYCWDH